MKEFSANAILSNKLKKREDELMLRRLKQCGNLTDFASNDYLGFAKSKLLKEYSESDTTTANENINGSGGSRLLTGNTLLAKETESFVALQHNSEAALIFNSGYDANLGLFSSVPQRGDTIFYDELVHASIRDGIRLSNAKSFSFKHNDLKDLERKIENAAGCIYVAVESVYSMDGDLADLKGICKLRTKYELNIIVDEAHAMGVIGDASLGLCRHLKLEEEIFARLFTYGKAMGVHGAAIVGSDLLKQYLVNYCRSFIYTTAPPPHFYRAIKAAYRLLDESKEAVKILHNNITLFQNRVQHSRILKNHAIKSETAIQAIIIGEIQKTIDLSRQLAMKGFDVRPILSPTVPVGKERLRICLHSYNTALEIENLLEIIEAVYKR